MEGHEAVVVSAAWSKDGKTAVTGDADGRVIMWDAKAMQETGRLELGGRVAALALSPDGQEIAAVVVGKQAEFYLWKAGHSGESKGADMQPIHIDRSDFSGPIHACLSFSPNGKLLTGSAINLEWQLRLGELVGKLHVWERK
jgi:WD40 repeat protein